MSSERNRYVDLRPNDVWLRFDHNWPEGGKNVHIISCDEVISAEATVKKLVAMGYCPAVAIPRDLSLQILDYLQDDKRFEASGIKYELTPLVFDHREAHP